MGLLQAAAGMEVRRVVVRAAARMVVLWARTAVRRVVRHLPVLKELVVDRKIVVEELVVDRMIVVEQLVLGRSIVLVDSNVIEIVVVRRRREFGEWLPSLEWDRTL